MKAFKAIEKPAKFFGLTFIDWLVILAVIGIFIFITTLIKEIGIPISSIWLRVILLAMIITLFVLMRWANKSKCPNFLLAWISFNLLQNKNIDACSINFQNTLEKHSKTKDMEILQE